MDFILIFIKFKSYKNLFTLVTDLQFPLNQRVNICNACGCINAYYYNFFWCVDQCACVYIYSFLIYINLITKNNIITIPPTNINIFFFWWRKTEPPLETSKIYIKQEALSANKYTQYWMKVWIRPICIWSFLCCMCLPSLILEETIYKGRKTCLN